MRTEQVCVEPNRSLVYMRVKVSFFHGQTIVNYTSGWRILSGQASAKPVSIHYCVSINKQYIKYWQILHIKNLNNYVLIAILLNIIFYLCN